MSPDEVGIIVQKCTSRDYSARFTSVIEVIADVDRLEVTPTQAPV